MRKRDPWYPGSMAAGVYRPREPLMAASRIPRSVQSNFIYGVIGGLDVYGSRLLDDRVQFLASTPGQRSGACSWSARDLYRPSQIANC